MTRASAAVLKRISSPLNVEANTSRKRHAVVKSTVNVWDATLVPGNCVFLAARRRHTNNA